MPQELQNVLNPSGSVALIGRKMTERFLEKQTANFYCFFYSWRRPGNKSGKFIPGFCRKTINLTKNNKLEKQYEEIRPSSLSQVYSEIYCESSCRPDQCNTTSSFQHRSVAAETTMHAMAHHAHRGAEALPLIRPVHPDARARTLGSVACSVLVRACTPLGRTCPKPSEPIDARSSPEKNPGDPQLN